MEGVNISNSNLPPGFRFHPTDQELIIHYLKKKVSSCETQIVSLIADIDLYKFNPWELPDKALFGEEEWFFFSPRARKYPNGDRPNRAAGSGYWKATGTDRPILTYSGSQCLGVKKALVFYTGRPPKGIKTDWLMHEYRLLDDASRSPKIKGSMRLDDWVLCRIRLKSSTPPHPKHESFFSGSPPFSHQSFDEQLLGRKNGIFDGTDNQYPAYLMESPEGVNSYNTQNICFKDTSKPATSNMASNPQGPLVFHQVLESIKRSLSITAMDELISIPPSKKLNSSIMVDDMSMMDVEDTSHNDFMSGARFSDFLV